MSANAKEKGIPTGPTGRARNAMIVVLLLSNMLASFSQSLMNVALDSVATEFHITLSQANWMVLAYAIITATVITMAASLLKRYGLRKILVCGYAFAFAGSMLGFFAWDYPSMIAARALQAVCTGLCFPLINEALLTIAPNGKAGVLLAVNSGIIGAGLAFAPPVSGLIITYVGLRELFLIPAAMALLLIIIGPVTIHDLYKREHSKIDILSVLMSCAGLACFMYGLDEISHDLLVPLVTMVAGIAIMGAFAWRQLRLKDPLLNMSPLGHKVFSVGEVLIAISFMASVYMSLLVPLYLEGAASYTPFIAGCMCIAPILCYAICCFPSGSILERHGIWPLVGIGFGIVLVGYVGMFFTSSLALVIPVLACSAIAYAGIGIMFPSVKSVDLESLPKDISAHGSAIHSTIVQIGSSVSSALFVGIMSGETASMMARGISKTDAYATSFSHTLVIMIALLVLAIIVSFLYSRLVKGNRELKPNDKE